jgi:UDP-N-acetylmuramyl pentapeptide phosphotransferase/UDP-N-acetylglucosamine-1-phosphate transferase
MSELFYYLLFFFISIGVSFYLNGHLFGIFSNSKMLDPINDRSSHKAKATRTGGLSLFLTICLGYAFASSAGFLKVPNNLVALGVVLMTLMGFIDDLFNIKYQEKFFLQLFAGFVVIQGGWSINSFYGIFGIFEIPYWLGFLVSMFVFIVIVNAVNLIDGLDGLASLISINFFLIIGGIILVSNKELFLFFPIIVGSLIGFLVHNFRASKKVFLGDSGSLLLGSLMAVFTIYILDSSTFVVTDIYISRPLLMVLSIFYPLLDTLRAVILRAYKGQSPFVADRIHLHHKLVDKGYEHWAASLLILCFSVFLVIINFLLYVKIGLLFCVVMTVVLCLIIYRFLFR